jgi:L-lactate dehydrogenase (cytochrome)
VCSIEDVAENTDKPFWFQLYVMKDREFIGRLIDRAKKAGCSALVLTLDLQIIGQRHKDIKNGLTTPPKPTLANILNIATKPRWCLSMLRTKRRTFGNVVGHAPAAKNMRSISMWIAEQFDPKLSWDDIKWIKDRWGGKLILKGILDPEDAERALQVGADAMIVSNHGGRQLDGALSSIAALPSIVRSAIAWRSSWTAAFVPVRTCSRRSLLAPARCSSVARSFTACRRWAARASRWLSTSSAKSSIRPWHFVGVATFFTSTAPSSTLVTNDAS